MSLKKILLLSFSVSYEELTEFAKNPNSHEEVSNYLFIFATLCVGNGYSTLAF